MKTTPIFSVGIVLLWIFSNPASPFNAEVAKPASKVNVLTMDPTIPHFDDDYCALPVDPDPTTTDGLDGKDNSGFQDLVLKICSSYCGDPDSIESQLCWQECKYRLYLYFFHKR